MENKNIFLKSKDDNKSNNRFSSLLEDDGKSSFKEKINSKVKKNKEYEKSNNSFKYPMIEKSHIHIQNRKFKDNNLSETSLQKINEPETFNIINFPDLVINKNDQNKEVKIINKNFKNILTNVIEVEKKEENPVPPGWVRLTSKNGKSIIEHGPPTSWMIKQQQKEEIEKRKEEDPKYFMSKAIDIMKKNWDLNERVYDSIHGEGAYQERFRVTPVYFSDSDSENDENEFNSEEEDL